MSRVSILIPAYNEADQIEAVLLPLVSLPAEHFEILVVDDGSLDGTSEKVAKFPTVKLIKHLKNQGKSQAIATGIANASGEIIVLLDADLLGIQPEHIFQLLAPLQTGQADATVGIFRRGRWQTDFAQWITPALSGQRAFPHSLIQGFPFTQYQGYQFDLAFEKWLKRKNKTQARVLLIGVSQRTKEEKEGFWRGFWKRLQMYYQVWLVGFSSPRRRKNSRSSLNAGQND